MRIVGVRIIMQGSFTARFVLRRLIRMRAVNLGSETLLPASQLH